VLGAANTWTRLQPEGVQPIGQFGLGPGFFEASRDELVFPFIGSALRWGAVPAPELTCPPDGSWSPGSIRDVNFELRDRAGVGFTYEYVISCERAWPGFPIQGSLSLAFSTERIQVGLPVPDTAAFGPVRFGIAVVPRGEPGLVTNCAFTLAGEPAPVVALNAVAQPGRALVRWRTSRPDLEVTIARRDEAGAWTAQVRRTVSTPGEVAYEDHDVRINQRYYYRLEVSDALLSGSYGTMRVDIPTWSFGFAPGQPVLLKSEFAVACDVAERGVVQLEAFDVCGRRVAAETRSVAGPGRIEFDLDPRRTASSGVYLLRLTQGPLTSRMRVIRIR